MRPTASNRKISWFSREEELGYLDLSPAFQRRPVWRDDQAAYLIDTILNGLPFPEIYMRAQTSPEGETLYQVVDGQQRIRSILSFARNDLALSGKYVSPLWLGKTFEDLSDGEKTAFWEYDVVTRELDDASDGDVRDLFRRLNISSVTLNDQELRHAQYTGEFIGLMETLANDEWWLDMRLVNIRQVRRMEDVEYVSELFINMMAGPQDKKKTLDDYYETFENDFPDRRVWAPRFKQTLELVASIFDESEIRGWSGKSDFYTLFGVLSGYVIDKKRFTRPQRQRVHDVLVRFRREVDQAKRRDNERVFASYIHEYADAVTRAATDIARRTTRHEIVAARIERARAKKK